LRGLLEGRGRRAVLLRRRRTKLLQVVSINRLLLLVLLHDLGNGMSARDVLEVLLVQRRRRWVLGVLLLKVLTLVRLGGGCKLLLLVLDGLGQLVLG
jgi:hypothetical protein